MSLTVFVSSTYVDLRHVREHISQFIEVFGYTPVLFEKGGIGFDWMNPIDESCYKAVSQADIFVLIIGGRYGSPATTDLNKKANKYNSVTRKEYIAARDQKIPIYIFVDYNVLTEYRTFAKNRKNTSVNYASVDSTLVFELLDDIYHEDANNYVHPFNGLRDITDVLKVQWGGILKSYIQDRARRIKRNFAKMNIFKMFYYRSLQSMSSKDLANAVGIDKKKILSLEKLATYRPSFDNYSTDYFPDCEFQLLSKIESTLNCPGKLIADRHDDFRAHFVRYYVVNSPHKIKMNGIYPFIPVQTKAVVFDFDGTISLNSSGRTTWELIWELLGYSVNECAELHRQFRRGDISHEEWCALTLSKFKARRLKKVDLLSISGNMRLVDGLGDLLDELSKRNIRSYIVSGSIEDVIKESLGTHERHFKSIKSNEMRFDLTGEIVDIVGTRFDFQGKADAIKEVVRDLKCSPMDVLFVGNAGNDGWAANAGARTLCVNPTTTDPDDPFRWTSTIRMMDNMKDIIPFI